MIGIFDSGIGGLSVLTHIQKTLPGAPKLYVADRAFAPYGPRAAEEIIARCKVIVDWMLAEGCQLIVVACNTATAIAIDTLRQDYSVPFVGVEPGVKPAALNSSTGKVAIFATENTLTSQRYHGLINRFLPEVTVFDVKCEGLALAIEQGDRQQIHRLLLKFTKELIEDDIDQLVLGCTHYPLVIPELSVLLPARVNLVDTGLAIATEAARQYRLISEQESGEGSERVMPMLYCSEEFSPESEFISEFSMLNWLHGQPVKKFTP